MWELDQLGAFDKGRVFQRDESPEPTFWQNTAKVRSEPIPSNWANAPQILGEVQSDPQSEFSTEQA